MIIRFELPMAQWNLCCVLKPLTLRKSIEGAGWCSESHCIQYYGGDRDSAVLEFPRQYQLVFLENVCRIKFTIKGKLHSR
jgi:hypothetical protein